MTGLAWLQVESGHFFCVQQSGVCSLGLGEPTCPLYVLSNGSHGSPDPSVSFLKFPVWPAFWSCPLLSPVSHIWSHFLFPHVCKHILPATLQLPLVQSRSNPECEMFERYKFPKPSHKSHVFFFFFFCKIKY